MFINKDLCDTKPDRMEYIRHQFDQQFTFETHSFLRFWLIFIKAFAIFFKSKLILFNRCLDGQKPFLPSSLNSKFNLKKHARQVFSLYSILCFQFWTKMRFWKIHKFIYLPLKFTWRTILTGCPYKKTNQIFKNYLS